MEPTPQATTASSKPERRFWRLLPLVAIAAVGLWFLSKAPARAELELVLDDRAQGLQSLEVAIALLPDELLVRRVEFFFSESHPAPPVVVVRTRLQEGRRYRVALGLSGAGEGGSAGPTLELVREMTYEGQSSVRLIF